MNNLGNGQNYVPTGNEIGRIYRRIQILQSNIAQKEKNVDVLRKELELVTRQLANIRNSLSVDKKDLLFWQEKYEEYHTNE